MTRSKAATVAEYLEELAPDRRRTLELVRDVVLGALPAGYEEVMNWGMITYEVPLSRYPNTYNGKPLQFAGLASQKNYSALYLNFVYSDPAKLAELTEAFEAANKKLDMGKSCLRFRTSDDLPLEPLARLIASVPVEEFISTYERARTR